MLWVYLFIVCVILYFTERYLIVYYFKIVPIQSNTSVKAFMFLIKYAPVLLLTSAATCIRFNSSAWENNITFIPYMAINNTTMEW